MQNLLKEQEVNFFSLLFLHWIFLTSIWTVRPVCWNFSATFSAWLHLRAVGFLWGWHWAGWKKTGARRRVTPLQNKSLLNSSLCRRGVDELSKQRKTQSHWGRKQLIYTHCHRHERRVWRRQRTEEDKANYFPCRESGTSPGFLQGGLSGCDSPVSKEETQRRWRLWEEKYDKYSTN